MREKRLEHQNTEKKETATLEKLVTNKRDNISLERQKTLEMLQINRLSVNKHNLFCLDLGDGTEVNDFRGFKDKADSAVKIVDTPDSERQLAAKNEMLKDFQDASLRSTELKSAAGRYDSAEAAAKAFAAEVGPSSRLQHCEFGSAIFFDPITKKYGYTEPKRYARPGDAGYNSNLDPATTAPSGLNEIPAGTKPYSRLHTHVTPDDHYGGKPLHESDKDHSTVQGKVLGKGADKFSDDPNAVSEGDKQNSRDGGLPNIVVTPNGHILKYDPKSGKTSDLTK